ncbi:phosphotransferase [Nocardia sp. GCM10030253]|uniref:phosphotransferase n=1 Tax=Nocardia sp. GCM10030253 TaxID=3273404 RepID=UPI0036334931
MIGRAVHAPAALLGQPLEPVLDWATGVLAARGVEITGPPAHIRRRAWSLIARIPTDAGSMWLKANARAFAHEGPLLQRLAALRPGSVLEPLAVQPDHGWLLSEDGGDTATDSEAEWAGLIERYVDLQQSLAGHVEDLRATGTPYLPPAQLITVYRHYEPRLPGLGAAIEETAAALEEFGRLSIEHNDLHPGNVFAGATAGTGMLFDWGDAVITHPFLSQRMLTGPHREQYFEHWRRHGPIPEAEVTLAERLAPLVSLNPWRTIDTARPRFARVVQELLEGLRAGFR